MVIELTEDNFAKVLAENKVVMVKFWAPWCGPCKAYGELFERVAADYPKMIWAQLNADDFPDVAVQYGVGGIPMTMCSRTKSSTGRKWARRPKAGSGAWFPITSTTPIS